MDNGDYNRKLDELDYLFNDDDAPLEPSRLWMLLAELVRHDQNPPGETKATS
ncbi:MAG: peptide chain release factor 1 [Acidocella sp.]|nr:peptide chain release factor 1 [Acidocella sp.]